MPQPTAIALDSWLVSLAQWLSPQQIAYLGVNPPVILQTALKGLQLHRLTQVVAEQTGPIMWHKASNPLESGLVPPERLQHYWQNLKTVVSQSVLAISLDEALLAQSTLPQWLWVDRLPALAILRGAPIALSHATAVIARVVISETDAPADADLTAVQAYMQRCGFVLAGVQPERNPALGVALFFKDYAKLALVNAQLAQGADKTIASLQEEVAQVRSERDTQLQATCQSEAESGKKVEALVQQVQDAAQVIANLEAERDQLQTRQQMLLDEITCAEAQIDLIKELLLKEPSL